MKVVLCFALVAVSSVLAGVQLHPLSDEFIDHINSQHSTWQAGRNFYLNISLTHLTGLLGVLDKPTKTLRAKPVQRIIEDVEIPEYFDAREAWPECADIIGHIRDQAACGSCWAFATVEAISDRICIYSKAEKKVLVSAENLMSCCSYTCGDGCEGGWPDSAWVYWITDGIVTGGDYGTTDGCQAYELAPCAHHIESSERPACGDLENTPACTKQCDAGTRLSYEEELSFGDDVYNVGPNEDEIKIEIMKNGPVEADYTVYDDFYTYKSGVYQYVEGKSRGGHAVKIIGWGVEDGTPYWLIANSWNSDWGDNGYFKMLRGSNHLGIEEEVIGGIPKL